MSCVLCIPAPAGPCRACHMCRAGAQLMKPVVERRMGQNPPLLGLLHPSTAWGDARQLPVSPAKPEPCRPRPGAVTSRQVAWVRGYAAGRADVRRRPAMFARYLCTWSM